MGNDDTPERLTRHFFPPWFKRVRNLAMLCGLAAFAVMFLNGGGTWAWSLAVPGLCVVVGWLGEGEGWWSTWHRILRARALNPATAGQGDAGTVRGRIRCEAPVVSVLEGRTCAAYVARTLEPQLPGVSGAPTQRQTMKVAGGLSLETADGARVALEPGDWRLLDPFGRGTLVAEARLDDGDEVAALGEVAMQAEAGDDYRTLRERAALRPGGEGGQGLLAPAAGRYAEDRILLRARFATWRWALLLAVVVAPGAFLARPLRRALSDGDAPRTPVVTTKDMGASVGGPGPCHSDDECSDGEQCDPSHLCVTDPRKRADEGEECSPTTRPCARGLVCSVDLARSRASGYALVQTCSRLCATDSECPTGRRCIVGLADSQHGPRGVCMADLGHPSPR